jgi:hypothetical protein
MTMRIRRWRRRNLTPKEKRLEALWKRVSTLTEVLKTGLGEQLKHCYDYDDLKIVLDIAYEYLVPWMKKADGLEAQRFASRTRRRSLRARTRETSGLRKTAKKSAANKKR